MFSTFLPVKFTMEGVKLMKDWKGVKLCWILTIFDDCKPVVKGTMDFRFHNTYWVWGGMGQWTLRPNNGLTLLWTNMTGMKGY